jgi:hypothetical protein
MMVLLNSNHTERVCSVRIINIVTGLVVFSKPDKILFSQHSATNHLSILDVMIAYHYISAGFSRIKNWTHTPIYG